MAVRRFPVPACALVLALALAGCAPAGGGGRANGAPRETVRTAIGTDPPGLNPLVFDNAQVSYLAPLIHGYLLRTDGAGRLIPDLATVVPTRANGGISARRAHGDVPPAAQRCAGTTARRSTRRTSCSRSPPRRTRTTPSPTAPVSIASPRCARLDASTVRVRLTQRVLAVRRIVLHAGRERSVCDPSRAPARGQARPQPRCVQRRAGGSRAVQARLVGTRLAHRARRRSRTTSAARPRSRASRSRSSRTRTRSRRCGRRGALDYVVGRVQLGRTFLDSLRSRPDAHVVLQPHYEFDFVLLNLAHPPLDDARVRRALAMGIDRKRIMRDLDGELWLDAETDRLPGQFAYDASIVQPRYDPAEAGAAARRGRLAIAAGRHAAQERPRAHARLRRDDRVEDDRPLRAVRAARSREARRARRPQVVQLQSDLGREGRQRHLSDRPLRSRVLRLAAQRRRRPLVPVPLRHAPAQRRQFRRHLRSRDRSGGARGARRERRPRPRSRRRPRADAPAGHADRRDLPRLQP